MRELWKEFLQEILRVVRTDVSLIIMAFAYAYLGTSAKRFTKNSDKPFSWIEWRRGFWIAGVAGTLSAYACKGLGINRNLTVAICILSGFVGAPMLDFYKRLGWGFLRRKIDLPCNQCDYGNAQEKHVDEGGEDNDMEEIPPA